MGLIAADDGDVICTRVLDCFQPFFHRHARIAIGHPHM